MKRKSVKEEGGTVFENHRKSLIQHCERSELRLHLSGQKLTRNAKNSLFWRVCENLKLAVKQCYQTLKRTKIGEKCQKCDFLSNFQTLCNLRGSSEMP